MGADGECGRAVSCAVTLVSGSSLLACETLGLCVSGMRQHSLLAVKDLEMMNKATKRKREGETETETETERERKRE